MAAQLPARYANSSFVQKLASSKASALDKARKLKASQVSTPVAFAVCAGGAAAGGALGAVVPTVVGVPTPAALAFAFVLLGMATGSPMALEAAKGNIALVAGGLAAMAVEEASGAAE